MRGLALATSLGGTFAVLVSFGALAGLALDRKLDTSPWLMIVGLLLGSVSAFYSTFRVVALFNRPGRRPGESETGESRTPREH